MATLTNIRKHRSGAASGGKVFYAWLFLFTIPAAVSTLVNVAKHSGSLINVAKN
jgi:hypothetical protein